MGTSGPGATTLDSDVTTNALLRAILAVLVEQREMQVAERAEGTKVEVLLATAGLGHNEIAQMLGKNPDAVRMAIKRAQAERPGTKARSSSARKRGKDDG